MSRYKAYPEYKDSGVEWLRSIPPHWTSRQLKYLCSYNDEVLSEVIGGDYEIEYVDIGSVSASDGISRTETMLFSDAPSRARRIVRDGDVIISTVRTYLEAIASIKEPPANLIASTGFAVIRPNKSLDKGYAAYCLRASGFIKEVVARSVGISYPAINASDLVNIKTPEPPRAEQEKIAAFLDHETAKIDALIEKQQRLIELLKEKRQAVISHAVTKGLNPNAPMKDSGVEWLGEVPTHWHVTKLGWICEFISYGFTNPMPTTDEGPYMLTAADIEFGRVNYEEARMTSEDAYRNTLSAKSRPIDGDLLLTKDGTLGRVTVFDGIHAACISQSIALLRLVQQKVAPEFLSTALMGGDYQRKIILDAGGTTIKHIYISILAKMNIALPEIEEQHEIVSALKSKLSKIDQLINSAQSVSALLQERRTALISAAVTGKIDVRHWRAAA